MEKTVKEGIGKNNGGSDRQPSSISPMLPLTREAYGGGMYGKEEQQSERPPSKPPASETQSADGPVEPASKPKHTPPPSTGDRDVDITGQSYIQ
ncbi:hypothetical protein Nepgr_020754 [Nepenthes gracilis]|uniref:Uncharacterized protein n=1 Tax=Nepenthes gracilis TaxID=150966 RepID=A0AAD3XVI1_NEPGR|nr:hypothetical protein Nepgr_020754 [Nepenthes gracilis]